MPKKTERGDPLGFSNIHSVAKQQKIEGGTLWGKNFRKNVSQCRKKSEGGPFGLPGYGMVRGKTEKTVLVQFARPNSAIIFCRTFKNYFGQFVWIEKKRKATIIVAFHFMKRRLKILDLCRIRTHDLLPRLTLQTSGNKPRTAKVGAISKAQNLEGGPFGLCETPAGCKIFLKIEGGPFGDMKKFPKKNIK